MPKREFYRRQTRRRYHWPELQLNLWILTVLAGSSLCLGIFVWFLSLQKQLNLGIPWLFPYMVVTGSLGVSFIILILILASQRFLLPGIILLGSFILFVLFLTGLIETSLQLYGPIANVNGACSSYVVNNVAAAPPVGESVGFLAWVLQGNICNCWKAAFSFELVNTIFFFWMMIMAWQVNRDVYD